MKTIELDKLKKINIAYEEIPELIMKEFEKNECSFDSACSTIYEIRTFILEISLPANASFYALLGAKFIPTDNNKNLLLEIRHTNDTIENYEDTLAYDKKTVFKGLPEEYVSSIKNAATDFLKSRNEFPSGKIIIDTAAHCKVGSSPLLFKIVTKSMLKALLSNDFPLIDCEIKNICTEFLLERGAAN